MTENSDWRDENGNEFSFEDLNKFFKDFMSQNQRPTDSPLQGLFGGTGIPMDLSQFQGIFQGMFSGASNNEVDWSISEKTALSIASKAKPGGEIPFSDEVFMTASLWLDEATDIGAATEAPRVLKPKEWVRSSIDAWVLLASPIAESIASLLSGTIENQLPEGLPGAGTGITDMLRRLGTVMFATQLGNVVGNLSTEVLSAHDIGIPLMRDEDYRGGGILLSNMVDFAKDLDQPVSEVVFFLVVRELAAARLFRHARWIRSHFVSAVNEFALGMEVDVDHFQDIAESLDPSDQEQIADLLKSGSLIPPKTERQEKAHAQLELLLALIEGWTDAVTAEAASRLPGSVALAEMMRRRRATGGPAEKALGNLIGLQLRPKKIREAAKMWTYVGEKLGSETRDSLWNHPDILPTASEIENPELLISRLKSAVQPGSDAAGDEMDRAIANLLAEESDGEDSGEGA